MGLSMHPSVTITAKGEQRLRSGHPWIYRSDIADVRAEGGDVVRVVSARGQTLGHALFSDRSQITLRVVTLGEAVFDSALLRQRIAAAVARVDDDQRFFGASGSRGRRDTRRSGADGTSVRL